MSDRPDDTSPDDDPERRAARFDSAPTDDDIEERLRRARLTGSFGDDDLDAGSGAGEVAEDDGADETGPAVDEAAAGDDGRDPERADDDGDVAAAGPPVAETDGPAEDVSEEEQPGPPAADLDDDHVEDNLGAAATLPSARDRDRAERGSRRGAPGDRPAAPPARRRSARLVGAVLVAVVLLAAVPLVAGTLEKTPRDRYGLSYGGGPIEGEHFQKVVDPGSGLFVNGVGDSLFLYPADQQSYIVGGGSEADAEGTTTDDAITAPTRDRIEVAFQVAVYFKLNIDRLREFHEQIGLRYGAYGPSGWDEMIQDTFRQQLESALQEQARRHEVAELFGDVDVLLGVQTEVEATLSERLHAALGDDYFCSPTYERGGECESPTLVIKRIDVPTAVLAAFERNRTAAIDVETRTREAEAIERLSAALAESGDQYVLLKAIESGQISFWVLPDGSVSLTVPDAGGAPATPGGDGAGGEGGG